MSHSSDLKKAGCETPDDTNVIQLGFNISVAGKSASDFQIFVNDKKQSCGQLSVPNLKQITSAECAEDQRVSSNSGLTVEKCTEQSSHGILLETDDVTAQDSRRHISEKSPSTNSFTTDGVKSSRSEDVTIIDEIKNAMGNFEKFSEHLREIPRLSTKRMSTSTPFPDKNNSRSEGNLSLYGYVPRSYIPKHDFRDRKYFRKPKPLSSDLFLKPLPAEDYFKKGYVRRYYDFESYHHYASMDNLQHCYDYGGEWKTTTKSNAKSDNDRSDALSSASDICTSESKAVSKKEGSEPADKQSTSSESNKDIKIYQSGGIIIMQNFKDNSDIIDKKDFIDSAKLIESCNKLNEKVESSVHSSDESQKLLLNSSSEDFKGQSTKFVQFDLSSCDNNRSKSCDSSSDIPKNDCTESFRYDSLNAISELSKEKDSALIFPPNQDLISLSTQENDSVMSNILGMSPTSSTSGKKLEWDSGADVGYLNMDLSAKENFSTIERIILKGLSDDGVSKKKVVYQRTEQETMARPSKFVLERKLSELETDTKNVSACKTSSSDQNSIPNRMTDNSTTTSLSLSSHSLSGGPQVYVPKNQQDTGINCRAGANNHEASSTDKRNHGTHSKKSKILQNQGKSGKTFDGNKEKSPSVYIPANVEEKCVQTPNIDINKDTVPSSDKSTYVNTLFSDLCFELPLQDISRSEESGRSESSNRFGSYHVVSPRVKKFKKKRNVVQGINLTAKLKDKIDTIIDIARHSNRSDDVQKPKGSVKSSEPVEVNHNIDDEKLREMEDVNDEQKHAKSGPASEPMCSLEKATQKDKTSRSRPISASSSSVRTVMPNADTSENGKIMDQVKNFSDQMIQTSELACESKAIQAFHSAKCSATSSQLGDGTTSNVEELVVDVSGVEVLKEDGVCRSILGCSKSIQAPGMNSSLPKHLAHPKVTISCEEMNTKATQFFGGSITSLPNYHSNTPMKDPTMGRVKILNNKINSNTQNNRIKQENVKNASTKKPNEREVVEYGLTCEDNTNSKSIDAGSDVQRRGMTKGTIKNKNDIEDKENLSVDEAMTDYSKRQSNCSRKESKTNGSLNNGSKKSDSMVFGSCEVFPSDDGKNVFLTSELLKEHGDRIDRNIIQEKYFQSQLLELERRELVSRTTSMEKKIEHERNTQTSFSPVTGVSVSCQYSPSLLSMSGEMVFYSKKHSRENNKGNDPRSAWIEQNGRNGCDSDPKKGNVKHFNTSEGFPYDEPVLAESLSSDTQTVDSWIPGGQQDFESRHSTDVRPLSVEYLPEHIYEDPLSLREKSFGETERNLQLGDSSRSNGTYSTPIRNSLVKNSESGHTLVLENTDTSPLESERMRSLNNNLTELEMVVSRLHEKEAIFQKITDSVLTSVSKVNGSGDSSHNEKGSRSENNPTGTHEICCEIEVLEKNSKSDGTGNKSRGVQEKSDLINEMSTACQTDTLKPDSSLLDEERKKLEQRMNDEKEQQIKWIENEIKHLNMLRGLLEKQEDINYSAQRKKRHHYLTETAEERSATATLKEEIFRKVLAETLSKTPSSVDETPYGDQFKTKQSPPLKLTEKSTRETLKLSAPFATMPQCRQLGMALSLRRVDNVREVTMLPVGIQVTLRDRKERVKTGTTSEKNMDSLSSDQSDIRVKQTPTISTMEFGRQQGTRSPDLNNQFLNTTPTMGSVDSMNRCGCFKCNKIQCVCLKTEGSDRRRSSRSSSQQSKTREPAGVSSGAMSGETSKQGLNIPEIREIADSKRESTNNTPSGEVVSSRDPSRQRQSYMSSEGSLQFEKCVCGCHAQPLPRCDCCHLLNTCKKCQCYRKIKCCLCKISASKAPLRKKCLTVSTSCLCNVDPCQNCRCSSVQNQVCSMCTCHLKASPDVPQCKCKKKFTERSCQTEGKKCNCCQCREQLVNEEDLYRETKYMSEKQHTTEKRKPSEVVYPVEQRYECESKHSVEEKFPYQMKVPVEEKKGAEMKNATEMKTGMENLWADKFQSLPVRELQGKKQCRCKSKQTRNKSPGDHPRHYFLQVEETTEEESSESCDNGNSLEVITIKVPIRKVCNGGRSIQSSPQKNSWKTRENGDAFVGNKYSQQKEIGVSECDCCEDCEGHSRKRSSLEDRPRTADYIPPRANFITKNYQDRDRDLCGCCEDCPGRAKLEEKPRPEFAMCDDYEQRKTKSMSCTKFSTDNVNERYGNPLKYSSNQYRCQETETDFSGVCNCCDCCNTVDDRDRCNSQTYSPAFREDDTSVCPSEGPEFSSTTESEVRRPSRVSEKNRSTEGKKEKTRAGKQKSDKCKKEGDKTKKVQRKSPSPVKPGQPHQSHKSKIVKDTPLEKNKDKCKSNNDYYNFNKKEFMTKSELEREEKKRRPTRLTLQECLTVKRPDLYTRAECRRKIISEKSKDRAERHNKRMECLTKLLPQCDVPAKNPDLKLFTSAQMRKQTRKFYKKLPEVANKQAEERKKMQFRTNKIMAEIFAKKLQLQTLKGRLNMSNSFTVMSTM